MSYFNENVFGQLGGILVDASLKSLLVGLLAGIILIVLRGRNVHAAHRVWTVVVLGIISIPLLSVLLPGIGLIPQSWISLKTNMSQPNSVNLNPVDDGIESIPERPGFHGQPDDLFSTTNDSIGSDEIDGPPTEQKVRQTANAPLWSTGDAARQDANTDRPNDGTQRVAKELGTRPPVYLILLGIGWSAGFVLMLVFRAIGFLQLFRLLASGQRIWLNSWFEIPARTTVLQSSLIQSPVVTGLYRHQILMPLEWRAWTEEKLRAVLSHESAHISRRDGLVVALSNLATLLYWYHPLAWMAQSRLKQLAEFCCDETAALKIGDRLGYAQQLIEIAALNLGGDHRQPGIAMARCSQISTRVGALLDTSHRLRATLSMSATCAILAAIIPAVVAVAAIRPRIEQKPAAASNDDPKYAGWFNMDGNVPMLTIHGEVFLPDGAAANDVIVEAEDSQQTTHQHESNRDPKIPVKSEGNKFTFTTDGAAVGVRILARSKDEKFMSLRSIPAFEMRQVAQDGLRMDLVPSRIIDVNINADGNPADNSVVQVYTGRELKTNCDGSARFVLAADEKIVLISAWSESFGSGGLVLYNAGEDIRNSDSFTIDLQRTTPVSVRCVDPKGQPVAGLAFSLYTYPRIGTKRPLSNELNRQVTDTNGVAICLGCVKYDDSMYGFSTENLIWKEKEGSLEVTDDQIIVHLEPAPVWNRKSITGFISVNDGYSPKGLVVELSSFDHPQESHTDHIYARVRTDGTFSADVLEGSYYAVKVGDPILDSEPWTGVPTDEGQSLNLIASKGVAINVNVTSGTNHEPIAGTYVRFNRHVNVRNGRDTFQKTVVSDVNGIARAQLHPGEVEIQVAEGEWSSTKKVTVESGIPLTVDFHRGNSAKSQFAGRLIAPAIGTFDLAKARIQVHSVDAVTSDSFETLSGDGGSFSALIAGDKAVVYAVTQDGRAAGLKELVVPFEGTLEIDMLPTTSYTGTLVGDDGKPLADYPACLLVEFENDVMRAANIYGAPVFLDTLNVKTDANGRFDFTGVPANMAIRFYAGSSPNSRFGDDRIGDRMFAPGENRPPETITIGPKPNPLKDASLSTRLQDNLLDCRVSQTHSMVIVSGDVELTEWFVRDVLLDTDTTSASMGYRPIWLRGSHALTKPEYQSEFSSRNWPIPCEDEILVAILNADGKERDRILLTINRETARQTAVDFINANQPAQEDAWEKINAAFAEARKSGRRVWATNSQTRCAPCFALGRWIDANHDLLDKDYVFVKIDDVRDKDGAEVSKEFISRRDYGIPFFAILDADGSRIIDSAGALGNIGFPESVEGKSHLKKMLIDTARKLTAEEIELLIQRTDK